MLFWAVTLCTLVSRCSETSTHLFWKISDECGKTIVAGMLFIRAMYRDQWQRTILECKQWMREIWIKVSLYYLSEKLVSILSLEDGVSIFLRNTGMYLRVWTASQLRITTSSLPTAWGHKTWQTVARIKWEMRLICAERQAVVRISAWSLFSVLTADSWPQEFDDTAAREDWCWRHEYDINKLVTAMIKDISRQHRLHESH
jgi:hypothetical protein